MKAYDLFQSYSHTDNSSPKNWAKDFHETLRSRLEVITPPEWTFNTFVDERSHDINDLPSNIIHALSNARFLIIIYSPAYLRSEWCRLERSYFLRSANKEDVFKVVKYDSDMIKKPDELMSQIEYRFYKMQNGIPIELDIHDDQYKSEMNRLAHDLIQYLDRKKNKQKTRVFLAETETHSWSERVSLSNEMKANQIDVLPNGVVNQSDVEMECKRLMLECAMSIHVLSPTTEQQSTIERMQLEIAKKLASEGKLDVKIWIPKACAGDTALLKMALQDEIPSDKYDVTIGSFEKFKSTVLSSLTDPQ